MTNKNRISWDDARDELLKNPEIREAYEAELQAEKLADILAEWRREAGLTSAQVAEKMGVSPSTVSRMEKNVFRAGLDIVYRYAKACGIKKPVLQLY
ncbi:TPA: helix-turn-helix domain-containing protein [Klebsiella pneumoniae]